MGLWMQRPDGSEANMDAPVSARVIAPERQIFPDGTLVELMPGAQISAAFTGQERRVALKLGGAHFAVTKDLVRPFIVEAAGLQVRAVGTAFAVQMGSAEIEVLVTEGRVAVARAEGDRDKGDGNSDLDEVSPTHNPLTPTTVDAGHQLIVDLVREGAPTPRAVLVGSTELTERLAWRVPRLDFTETSIAEAVALFNRHNSIRIRIGEGAVLTRRITGVFRSDNIDGFVRALESTMQVKAERRGGEIVLRSSAAPE
jgi:transmembrane sensor